jgi:hypothetical protein
VEWLSRVKVHPRVKKVQAAVASAPDAEQETPARDLVDRGDEVGGLDRVALDNETHADADFGRFVAAAAAVSVTTRPITSS